MVETAQAVLDLGSNVLKITMGRDYRRMVLKPSKTAYPETMQYVLNQGSDARAALRIKFPGASVAPPPEDPAIQSLADLARLEPSYETKLPAKPGIAGKRVFIGEFGFAAHTNPEPDRDRRSRQVMRVGLEWGCPFVLSWAMYNNEYNNGVENGYWLIDNQGVKQPEWHTLADYYCEARRYVADCQHQTGHLPPDADFRRFALEWLSRSAEVS
jgi:hypothetical protein